MLVLGLYKLGSEQIARFERSASDSPVSFGKHMTLSETTLYLVRGGWVQCRSEVLNVGAGDVTGFPGNAILVKEGIEHWFEVKVEFPGLSLRATTYPFEVLTGHSLAMS